MTPKTYTRIRAIFHGAYDLPESERGGYIERECGGDADLRAEVESLLANSVEREDAFEESRLGVGRELIGAEPSPMPGGAEYPTPPDRIGEYRIRRRLGEGGMGVVYEAEQENPRRRVALKVVRPGAAHGEMLNRLQREAQVLARLQHPGIALVYEAGFAHVGDVTQPYFAMELVQGVPLDEFVARRGLCARSRLELVARVCDAVQHAHDMGVIHRDLKPRNILVVSGSHGSADGQTAERLQCGVSAPCGAHLQCSGQPKILDFGVARITGGDQSMITLQTAVGQLVGTLSYMSPEQVSGDSTQIDSRSDVYSIGVILYELLAGRPPYDLRNCSLPEAAHIVRETDATSLGSFDRAFKGDVETLVAKALDKDRDRRYQSAGELAADIRRYLTDQPLVARPDSTFYQLRKFAKRNRALVGGAAATFITLILGVIVAASFAARESQQRAHADAASQEARWLAYRVSVSAAADAIENQNVSAARRLLDQAPEEFRGWEWRHLRTRLDQSLMTLTHEGGSVQKLSFSPDGSKLLASQRGAVTLWDLSSGRVSAEFGGEPKASAAWSSDLGRLAVVSGEKVTVHDLASGGVLELPRAGSEVCFVTFSGDGRRLAVCTEGAGLHVWDAVEGNELLAVRPPDQISQASFSPSGDYLAAISEARVDVLNAHTGETLCSFGAQSSKRRKQVAWSADDSLLFIVSLDVGAERDIARYDIVNGRELPKITGHKRSVTCLRCAGSRRIISSSHDGTVRIWDLVTGETEGVFTSQAGGAFAPTPNPAGKLLAFGNDGGGVEVWNIADKTRVSVLPGHRSGVRSLAFSDDGAMLAAGASDGEIRLWSTELIPDPLVLRGHTSYVYPVAFSPDGSLIASGSWDHTVRLWDGLTGAAVGVLRGHKAPVHELQFSADGRRLATLSQASGSSELFVWDVETGAPVAVKRDFSEPVRMLGLDTDGARVWIPSFATGGEDVRYWDVDRNDVCEGSLTMLQSFVSRWIGPGGKALVRMAKSRDLLLVSTETGQVLHKFPGRVQNAAFSPDGGRLLVVSATSEGSRYGDRISVWSTATGRELTRLRGHSGDVFDAVFSPDGERIVTCGRDKTIRVWSAETYEEIVPLRGHTDYVWSIAFSPDGACLVSSSGDCTVRMWETRSMPKLLKARHERAAMLVKLEPKIAALHAKLGNYAAVAAAIRADRELQPRERHLALQSVLIHSLSVSADTAIK